MVCNFVSYHIRTVLYTDVYITQFPCTDIYMYGYIDMHMHTHTETLTDRYLYTYAHKHAHTHMHTRTCTHTQCSYNIIRFCYVSFYFQMEYHIYVYQFILHSTYIITAPTLTKVHTHMYICTYTIWMLIYMGFKCSGVFIFTKIT